MFGFRTSWPVAERLGDVRGANGRVTVEISDGSRHAEYAVKRASREMQALTSGGEQFAR